MDQYVRTIQGITKPWSEDHIHGGNKNCKKKSSHLLYISPLTPLNKSPNQGSEKSISIGGTNRTCCALLDADMTWPAAGEVVHMRACLSYKEIYKEEDHNDGNTKKVKKKSAHLAMEIHSHGLNNSPNKKSQKSMLGIRGTCCWLRRRSQPSPSPAIRSTTTLASCAPQIPPPSMPRPGRGRPRALHATPHLTSPHLAKSKVTSHALTARGFGDGALV
jgi:hypothetical protein